MFCTQCGSQIANPQATFCPKCGSRLRNHSAQQQTQQQTQPTGQNARFPAQTQQDFSQTDRIQDGGYSAQMLQDDYGDMQVAQRKWKKPAMIAAIAVIWVLILATAGAVTVNVLGNRNAPARIEHDPVETIAPIVLPTTATATTAAEQMQPLTTAVTDSAQPEEQTQPAQTQPAQTVLVTVTVPVPQTVPVPAPTPTPAPAPTPSVIPAADSNFVNGNIVNGGHAAYADGVYYIADTSLYSMDAYGNRTVLLNQQVDYLNVHDGWLYFVPDTQESICRMRTNGADYQVLFDEVHCHELYVYGGQLYFVAEYSSGDQIRSLNLDGSQAVNSSIASSSDEIWYMTFANGTDCFYTDLAQNRAIYYMELPAGLYHEKQNDGKIYDLLVLDGHIYCSMGSDERVLCRLDYNGNLEAQLNASYSRNLNYMDGWLYYRDQSYNLHRCDLNGQNDTVIAGDCEFINVVPGKIVYNLHSREGLAILDI